MALLWSGHGNPTRAFYRLPLQAECAPDYWLSEWVLGHVRMKEVKKVAGCDVTDMYKEQVASDKKNLIAEYQARG